jgi:hypothetical protein
MLGIKSVRFRLECEAGLALLSVEKGPTYLLYRELKELDMRKIWLEKRRPQSLYGGPGSVVTFPALFIRHIMKGDGTIKSKVISERRFNRLKDCPPVSVFES